jgi:PHD/YefM family antitoxin component YafN of YafNO toxin-antitoxin module
MTTVMPVSSLRNYSDVLVQVGSGSPVLLTDNERERYAILDMADYDRLVAEQALLSELQRGRVSGEPEGWVPTPDVRERFA